MTDTITSFSNLHMKNFRKLRDRKYREESGLFTVEGPRIVAEALSEKWIFEELVFAQELLNSRYAEDLVDTARQNGIPVLKVNAEVFRSLSMKDGPKGIAAVLHQRWAGLSTVKESGGLWIGLDRVQDPGNLGTIMRTADSVGARGILLIDGCTDPYAPAAVRASMGAIFSVNLVKTTSDKITEMLFRERIEVIGTSDAASIDFRSLEYDDDMILLMGSEREGISTALESLCTQLVFIPMQGKSDSLNLAVATAICMYEVFRQKHPIKEGQ